MKIMIMDPHALSSERMVSLIKGQPDIEIIGDGYSELNVIEQALTHRPHIIFMSASLFEHSGKEVMSAILSETPETAFVILAPPANSDLLLSVIRNGGKGFLSKNISEASLLRSL